MISDIAKLTCYKILSTHQKYIYGKKPFLLEKLMSYDFFLFVFWV